MKWRLVAIAASLVPIAVIAVQFDISVEDVLAVSAASYAAAVGAMMAKLGVQGAKFVYITRTYAGRVDSAASTIGVRVGSEFIRFTTPMFVGAEFVVIYWLHKKGVPASKASWIAIMDIVTEVFAGGALSITAGVIIIAHGAYEIGAIVLATSVSITALWMALFFLSSRRVFAVPRPLARLAAVAGGERGSRYVAKSNAWIAEVCAMSRENLSKPETLRVFGVCFAASLASWALYGISFMAITADFGIVGAFDSVMAVMAANAIGNLPITVGGSGLAEFGVVSFLEGIGSAFGGLEEGLKGISVVGWRIATYYIPIAITGALLVRLVLGRYAAPEQA